jgi:predicted exporter
LETSEALAAVLQGLQAQHRLGGFDLPSTILPSAATQARRQAALPEPDGLRARLQQASAGLPFRGDLFEPFLADAARAKAGPIVTEASLPPPLALQLQSMLVPGGHGWTVIAPLYGVADPAVLAAAVAAMRPAGPQFVDLDHESAALLRVFQRDAALLAGIGSAAILVVLLIGLRSPRRVLAVAAPLAAAVMVTAALLTLDGGRLSIFMVVGFLLIIAVGSNYCLFFERPEPDRAAQRRSVASIVLANLCTVSAYGLMSLSRIPVLHDIGLTVALGTFLSLLFAAAISARGLAAPASAAEGR